MPVTILHLHWMLAKARGKAATHLCVSCGQPARDWAYQHTAGEAELHDPDGVPYSENYDDYAPMCRGCHIKLDGTKAERMLADLAFAERMRAQGRRVGAYTAKRKDEDPEFLAKLQANMAKARASLTPEVEEKRKANALAALQERNASRRVCKQCGWISNPGGLGMHQKATSHAGWDEVV